MPAAVEKSRQLTRARVAPPQTFHAQSAVTYAALAALRGVSLELLAIPWEKISSAFPVGGRRLRRRGRRQAPPLRSRNQPHHGSGRQKIRTPPSRTPRFAARFAVQLEILPGFRGRRARAVCPRKHRSLPDTNRAAKVIRPPRSSFQRKRNRAAVSSAPGRRRDRFASPRSPARIASDRAGSGRAHCRQGSRDPGSRDDEAPCATSGRTHAHAVERRRQAAGLGGLVRIRDFVHPTAGLIRRPRSASHRDFRPDECPRARELAIDVVNAHYHRDRRASGAPTPLRERNPRDPRPDGRRRDTRHVCRAQPRLERRSAVERPTPPRGQVVGRDVAGFHSSSVVAPRRATGKCCRRGCALRGCPTPPNAKLTPSLLALASFRCRRRTPAVESDAVSVPIFDGKTLTGGTASEYWRVRTAA